MRLVRRSLGRVGVAATLAVLFWVAAFLTSRTVELLTLRADVHGLSLADYSAGRRMPLAPLSHQIIAEARRDAAPRSGAGGFPSQPPVPSPSATGSLPTAPAAAPPGPVPTPLPSAPAASLPAPPPVPLPTLSPPPPPNPTLAPIPSLPPLPTLAPAPLSSPTPTPLPLTTSTLPSPPALP